VSNYSMEFD